MALQTSPDEPVPVQEASRLVGAWIERLGEIWVEGQIAQMRKRRTVAWITLRDADAEVSIPVMANLSQLNAQSGTIAEGDRVVVRAKPSYFRKQGQLQWRAAEFRTVGIGDLLARIEELKRLLAAEGLFAAERKRPLPFLPRSVGLISGRGSAARKDVEENARRRWPNVQFHVREVPVQGPKSAIEVTAAIADLASVPDVEVIVIARGGGSMEDLLPFSNETLIRAVSQCATPVVSAIGHEEDTPLLDLVADLRASTPTDAAKRIVPDVQVEMRDLTKLTNRLERSLTQQLAHERSRLEHLTSRPVMTQPSAVIDQQRDRIEDHRSRGRRAFANALRQHRIELAATNQHRNHVSPALTITRERQQVAALADQVTQRLTGLIDRHRERLNASTARLRTMSPQSTLDRGYALVRLADGTLLRDARQAEVGQALDTRIASGSVQSVVIGIDTGTTEHEPEPPPVEAQLPGPQTQ